VGRFGTIVLAGFLLGPSAAAPMGLALDLPPLVALVAVLVGVFASFLIALFATERVRAFTAGRRAARAAVRGRDLNTEDDTDQPRPRRLLLGRRRYGLLGRRSVLLRLLGRLGARWSPFGRRRASEADRAAKRARTTARARALLTRFGPVGFGLVGPALFGTWISAALGTALGLARWRLLTWLVVGATVWTSLLVLASNSLFSWLFV
jgi:hypothetical protein